MKSITLSIMRKEFFHILRDPQSLLLVVMMPLVMLLLFGYAINLELKSIDAAVIDESHSPASREFVERLTASDFFRLSAQNLALDGIETAFQSRQVKCVFVIPQDYARRLVSSTGAGIELFVDASDPNVAAFISGYASQIASADHGTQKAASSPSLFLVDPRILYNPDMKSADFFVPGLIAVILIMISTLLTSIAIVREKETGTIEQLLVSPVKPYQIILGKVMPYTAIGFLDGLLILVIGALLFSVPIQGSFALVLLMMLIYTVTGISLGILVSTLAKTQAVAMLIAVILTVLPTTLLSGFIFPITSIPVALQWVTNIVPATHFLQIIRGIILKGNGIMELLPQTGILLGMDLLLILLSVRSFRARLD